MIFDLFLDDPVEMHTLTLDYFNVSRTRKLLGARTETRLLLL